MDRPVSARRAQLAPDDLAINGDTLRLVHNGLGSGKVLWCDLAVSRRNSEERSAAWWIYQMRTGSGC